MPESPDLAAARRALAEHQVRRPSNHDIPALTAWVEEKDRLRFEVERLESGYRVRWKDVTPSEVPMPARKSAAERLQTMIAKHAELVGKIPAAPDKDACARLRQQAHTLRTDIKVLCTGSDLEMPQLPDVPANPYTQAGKTDPGRRPSPVIPEAEEPARDREQEVTRCRISEKRFCRPMLHTLYRRFAGGPIRPLESWESGRKFGTPITAVFIDRGGAIPLRLDFCPWCGASLLAGQEVNRG